MLVKCIAVPKERTPKKVEVILTKALPERKNVIRLNARVAEPVVAEYENIFVSDMTFDEANDNLNGIIPVDEYYASESESEASHENDIDELTDIFFEEADDLEAEISSAEAFPDSTPSAEDISSMISELNSDIDAIESDLLEQIEGISDDNVSDESIVQRHFIRNDSGELYESDCVDEADGHEVACYDNEGRLKRACGVIRKGQSIIAPESDDDVFGMAAADMFSASED